MIDGPHRAAAGIRWNIAVFTCGVILPQTAGGGWLGKWRAGTMGLGYSGKQLHHSLVYLYKDELEVQIIPTDGTMNIFMVMR